MNDNDFISDPIFKLLREFAANEDAARTMPSDIREGFRSGIKIAKKRRYAWRGALGAGLMIIAFPTLAAAKILPNPIQHFVESVNRVIASPVHKLIELGTAKNAITQNRDIKSAKKRTNGLKNFTVTLTPTVTSVLSPDDTSILSPSEAPTQKGDASEQGILGSLGKANESGKPQITFNVNGDDGNQGINKNEGAGNRGINRSEKNGSASPTTPNQNEEGTAIINPSINLPSLGNSNDPTQTPRKSPPSHDLSGKVDNRNTHKSSK